MAVSRHPGRREALLRQRGRRSAGALRRRGPHLVGHHAAAEQGELPLTAVRAGRPACLVARLRQRGGQQQRRPYLANRPRDHAAPAGAAGDRATVTAEVSVAADGSIWYVDGFGVRCDDRTGNYQPAGTFVSTDGGRSWRAGGQLPRGGLINSVYPVDATHAFTVGLQFPTTKDAKAHNTVYRTSDGGRTWVAGPSLVLPGSTSADQLSDRLWSAGAGRILATINGRSRCPSTTGRAFTQWAARRLTSSPSPARHRASSPWGPTARSR